MIQIEDTKEIPKAFWTETSNEEFASMPDAHKEFLLSKSQEVKLFSYQGVPLLMAGLYRQTFLSTPYLWVLVTKRVSEVPPSVLRQILSVADEYLSLAETLIEEGNLPAERLARLFKFKATTDLIAVGAKTYRVYRRVKWLS